MSNGQVWEIRREIDCDSVNVKYYLKCKIVTKKKRILAKQQEAVQRDLKLEKTSACPIVKKGFQQVSSRVMYTILVLRIIA